MAKHYLDENVYDSAVRRMEQVFEHFPRVYVSFSAGKDSSAMVHLALDVARRMGRLPLDVLYIDFEAQYRATIEHARQVLSSPDIRPHWVALPMNLRNAVSQYQPHWLCWDPDAKDKWVRPMPEARGVISDPAHFPWFYSGMEFEEFIVKFAEWFAQGEKTACVVAIRSDESLNRFRTIQSSVKDRYLDWQWSTTFDNGVTNVYPIYDWRTEDVWTAVGRQGWPYNRIYDAMYQLGQSIHESRLCQPYGDDQRKGLDLFRKLEPETWAKVVDRVAGANFGNIYCQSYLLGHKRAILPEGHTWHSYTEFLLETIPRFEKEWYLTKFRVFERWWAENGWPSDEWPDATLKPDELLREPHRRANGEPHRRGPSWERLAKTILKNDKLCKGLSFAQTKWQYRRYREMREIYGD